MDDDDNYDLIFKIVLIGDSGVGKTNILSRFINNEFSLTTQATVGVEFGSKIIKKGEKLIKLQIWDTAGQERYKSITSAYYKGSKGAFVVYDISRKSTFDNVDKWIDELKNHGSEDVFIMLDGLLQAGVQGLADLPVPPDLLAHGGAVLAAPVLAPDGGDPCPRVQHGEGLAEDGFRPALDA